MCVYAEGSFSSQSIGGHRGLNQRASVTSEKAPPLRHACRGVPGAEGVPGEKEKPSRNTLFPLFFFYFQKKNPPLPPPRPPPKSEAEAGDPAVTRGANAAEMAAAAAAAAAASCPDDDDDDEDLANDIADADDDGWCCSIPLACREKRWPLLPWPLLWWWWPCCWWNGCVW